MKKTVAIIVGHYGPGTGASCDGRDEWTMAFDDALALYESILHDGKIWPKMFYIDRREFRWRILDDLMTSGRTLRIKYNWTNEVQPDACLELHYNSAADNHAHGNELLVFEKSTFSDIMDLALTNLPNKHRPLKERPDLFLLRKLQDIPTAIIEPAFIFENCVVEDNWRSSYVSVLKNGLYHFMLDF